MGAVAPRRLDVGVPVSSEHAIRLLEELSAGQRPRWTLVDTAWTPALANAAGRDNENLGYAGKTSKPSDGLEPSTPLTMRSDRQLVATGNGFRLSEPFSGPTPLPPVATGCDRWAP
jgi:hypothetical protein